MECGGTKDRNKKYEKEYNDKLYFSKLLNLNKNNIDGKDLIIFDVGAHRGESVIFFKNIFPDCEIHSFEPVKSNYEEIVKINLPNVFPHNLALSNTQGTADFYVQDITHLSSLNKINKNSKDSFEYHKKEKHNIEIVDVTRGDKFVIDNQINKIDLLKIDVQANEVNTLEGFRNVINNVKCILIEVAFYDFYEKSSSIRDIEEIIPNFSLFDIFEVSKNPFTLGSDWANLVYKNKKFTNYR